jgi:Electron transfer DM13
MKSRRFVVLAGLSFTTLTLLGCDRTPTVSQPSPSPVDPPETAGLTPVSQPSILRSGRFVSGEHPTLGTAQIVMQNNQRRLELDSAFSTSTSGPDLFVVFHRLADVIGSTTPPAFPIQTEDFVLLAPLKQYNGAQSYPIPDDLNLDNFQSVVIWCRRFNATFGAARLDP